MPRKSKIRKVNVFKFIHKHKGEETFPISASFSLLEFGVNIKRGAKKNRKTIFGSCQESFDAMLTRQRWARPKSDISKAIRDEINETGCSI